MRRYVKRVIDGDTIEVIPAIKEFSRVRLAKVTAPPITTTRGKIAAKTLKDFIEGKNVIIFAKGKSYNRLVAEVFYYGKSINEAMRKKGYMLKRR